MTLNELLNTLDDGATKLNIIDSQSGEVLYRGIWFCEIDPIILDYNIKKIFVEDYLLNLFI